MKKTVLITGATGHLGSVLIQRLVSSSYEVLAVARKMPKTKIQHVHYFEADLTNDERVRDLVQEIFDRFKQIDAAVLTAGGFSMGNFTSTGKTELEQMLKMNFETAYYPIRHLIPRLVGLSTNTKIIFISAKTSLEPTTGINSIGYYLSKSLINHLSELVHAAGKGKVLSYVIAPSIIDSSENRLAMPNADFSKWVTAESIADTIEFICSGKKDFSENNIIIM